MTALLRLEGVGRDFGGVRAVDDVSLELGRGGITSLIGPNGAGKTTLFNIVAGSLPSRGRVVFDGRPLGRIGPGATARLGIVKSFQHVSLLPGISVLEHLRRAAFLRSIGRPLDLLRRASLARAREEADIRAGSLLALADLTPHRDEAADQLPYGLQKMLGLAMAAAARPRLLLADEPAAGLNATETLRLEAFLNDIRDLGTTILLVEHDLGLVMRISGRVLVLAQGRLIADGPPGSIGTNERVVEAYLGRARVAA